MLLSPKPAFEHRETNGEHSLSLPRMRNEGVISRGVKNRKFFPQASWRAHVGTGNDPFVPYHLLIDFLIPLYFQ